MEIKVFSKESCSNCRAVKGAIDKFLADYGVAPAVKVVYYDVDSEEGMAEGAFHDVLSTPTTIVEDQKRQVARWDGVVPKTDEIAAHVKSK